MMRKSWKNRHAFSFNLKDSENKPRKIVAFQKDAGHKFGRKLEIWSQIWQLLKRFRQLWQIWIKKIQILIEKQKYWTNNINTDRFNIEKTDFEAENLFNAINVCLI